MSRALLVAVLLLAATPASAFAARPWDPGQPGGSSPVGAWATVNVCDTAKHPDAIGIRASTPGFPKGARLAMRFRVQYRTDSGVWQDVAGADSGWRAVGVAHGYPVESGRSFTFAHSATAVTLRGMVGFRARRPGAAPRFSRLATTAGHRSSAGADPPGYSAATCTLG
jgi:hypothetical protein